MAPALGMVLQELEMQQSPVCVGPLAAWEPGSVAAQPDGALGSRKCKVVCTVGPACEDVEVLARLIDAGMDACCVSFFNESKEDHAATIRRIREAAELRPGKEVAIILDPRVNEMRTGVLAGGGTVSLRAGSELRLVTDMSVKGDEHRIAVSSRRLPSLVQPGSTILCAEGSVVLQVVSCSSREVLTRVVRDCRLGERRDVRVLGTAATPLPVHSPAALREAAKFALAHQVDFITASCSRGVLDVRHVQEALGSDGQRVGILARADSEAGLQYAEDVLAEADGLLLERAELAARLSPERALLAQKLLAAKCATAGKPMVVGSHVLQSMAWGPSPSRAEAADIVNSALDGADAVLLAEASASGGFPEEAVAAARRACVGAAAAAEPFLTSLPAAIGTIQDDPLEAACHSALEAAARSRAKALVAVTETGLLARALALHRPRLPIVAVTSSSQTARSLQVWRGVEPVVTAGAGSFSAVQHAASVAERAGLVSSGDTIVAVHTAAGTSETAEAPSFQTWPLHVGGSDAPPQTTPLASPRVDRPDHRRQGIKVEQAKLSLEGALGSPAKSSSSSKARRCKIVCTMGPKCWDVETLVKLIDAGMDVCRLNLSRGDHVTHAACVQRIREAAALRPERTVAIQLDTKGPEVRTGSLRAGGSVDLKAGQTFKLMTDTSVMGDATCIAVDFALLPTAARPGMKIFIAHGALALEVVSCEADHVLTTVLNDFQLEENQSVHLPGIHVDLPIIQAKDRDDLANFAVPQGVDIVAASLVRSATDVHFVRGALGPRGQGIKVVAKIGDEVGLQNFDEILAECDGIIVDRGDLGLRISPERAVLAQKLMIRKCNLAGKPVTTMTHLLGSMAEAPEPTQAEVADVANAVLDGTDCVALGGETAVGRFPEASVAALRRICEAAQAAIEAQRLVVAACAAAASAVRSETGESSSVARLQRKGSESAAPRSEEEATVASAVASVVQRAAEVNAGLIVVDSPLADILMHFARWQPAVPILAVVPDARTARQMAMLRGVVPLQWPAPGEEDAASEFMVAVADAVKRMALCDLEEQVVVLRGSDIEVAQLPEHDRVESEDSDLGSFGIDDQSSREAASSSNLKVARRYDSHPATTLATAVVAAVKGALPRLIVTALARFLQGHNHRLAARRNFELAEEAAAQFFEENQTRPGVFSHPSGLQYKVLTKGRGQHHPQKDSPCVCHYEGRVLLQWPNGDPFDSTFERHEPAKLRPEELIAGWQQALLRMVEGDQWEVYIPPELGYGEQGSQPHVGPGEGLVFVIELLTILGDRQPLGRRASFNLGHVEKLHVEEVSPATPVDLADWPKARCPAQADGLSEAEADGPSEASGNTDSPRALGA